MLLNNEWVNNKIKKEIKTHLETKENDHTTTRMKSMGHSESSPEREVHSIIDLHQKAKE